MSDPYASLAALAERELELVSAGELDALPALQDERARLVSTLPAVAPASARPALERAAALQVRTTAALAQGLRDLGGELDRLDRGRVAVRGYRVPAAPAKLVDSAA